MKRSLLLASAFLLVAAAFSVPLTRADQTPPATRPAATQHNNGAPNPYNAQFTLMSRSLQLSPEQTAKIRELSESMINQMDEARFTINKKLRDDSAAAFTKNGDERTALLHQLHENVTKARADYEKLVADAQSKINAELKPDQRLAWENVKLYHALSQHLGNVQFSDDQSKQISLLIEAAAKDLAATPDGVTSSSPITGKLFKKLFTDILTEQQAAEFVLAPNVPAIQVPQAAMSGGTAATRPAKAAKAPKDPGLP